MSIEHPDDYSSAPIGAGEPYAAPAKTWGELASPAIDAALHRDSAPPPRPWGHTPRYFHGGVEITRDDFMARRKAHQRAVLEGADHHALPALEVVGVPPCHEHPEHRCSNLGGCGARADFCNINAGFYRPKA